ncbi:MAG: cytochrome c-type biogenesis protein CcmH [Acidimicrobiales bacterium]
MSVTQEPRSPAKSTHSRPRWLTWLPWLAIALAAGGLVGFGLRGSSTNNSIDARVAHIASLVRCPVCNGETVAQSQATPAVEIESQIRSELQAGESQGQILSGLVGEYGQSILEKPPASGAGLWVWMLPLAAGLVAVAVLVAVLVRWRRRGRLEGDFPPPAAQPDAAQAPGIADLPSGVSASELADRADPPAADLAGRVDSSALGEPPEPTRRLSRRSSEGRASPARRRVVAGTGAVLVVGGVVWALAAFTGTRLPGEEISGKTLTAPEVTSELLAANTDESKGNIVAAVGEYQKVLNSDQTNIEALTGEGWLLAQTGQPALLNKGLEMLVQAEKINPAYPAAHVYRGIALLGEGDYTDAIPELQWYLDHQPAQNLKAEVAAALSKAKAEQAAASKG